MLFNSHRWTVCWNSVNLLSNWNTFQSVSGLPFLHNTEVKNETKKTFLFKAFLTNSFSLGEKFLLRVLSDDSDSELHFKFLARSSYYLLRDSWQEVRTDRSWWTSPTGDHNCRSNEWRVTIWPENRFCQVPEFRFGVFQIDQLWFWTAKFRVKRTRAVGKAAKKNVEE